MTFGSSYPEVRKNEGSRNLDSTVFQQKCVTVSLSWFFVKIKGRF